VGALWVQAARVTLANIIRGNLLSRARTLWSMPPDHGAAVVRLILQDRWLQAEWCSELDDMRGRINEMRELLSAARLRLQPIRLLRGMFAVLPVSPQQVAASRVDHGIYMPANGRINIVGLTVENIPRLISCLPPYL
jgi:aromatic-amino-acid transaminase